MQQQRCSSAHAEKETWAMINRPQYILILYFRCKCLLMLTRLSCLLLCCLRYISLNAKLKLFQFAKDVHARFGSSLIFIFIFRLISTCTKKQKQKHELKILILMVWLIWKLKLLILIVPIVKVTDIPRSHRTLTAAWHISPTATDLMIQPPLLLQCFLPRTHILDIIWIYMYHT